MRTRLGAFLAASLLALSAQSEAESGTGSQLLQSCGTMVTASGELRDMEKVIEETYGLQPGMCLGFVSGVLALNAVYELQLKVLANRERKKGQEPSPDLTAFFCAPSNYTNGQGVLVLTKYLRAHPEKLNEPDFAVAVHAFEEAWPCEASPQK